MVSEKHLALLASSVAMVLATLSVSAIMMVNSVRADLDKQKQAFAEHAEQFAVQHREVTELWAALKSRTNPEGDEHAQSTAGRTAPSGQAEQPQAASSATASQSPTVIKAPKHEGAPRGESDVARRPAAPAPIGVLVFPAKSETFVPGPVAADSSPGQPAAVASQAPQSKPGQAHGLSTAQAQKPLESVDGILVERIVQNWKRPKSARNGMFVDVEIQMSRDGVVKSVKVVRSSGDKPFDLAATAAVVGVKKIAEMKLVSDATYEQLYRKRHIRLKPEDLSG